MEPETRNLKHETPKGQVLPLLMIFMTFAMIPATAYMVDFGYMYRGRSFAQNMVDAGSYAGVQEMVKRVGTPSNTGGSTQTQNTSGPTGDYYSSRTAKISGAVNIALSYLTQNGMKSTDTWVIELGEWNNGTGAFTTHDTFTGTGNTISTSSYNSFAAGFPTTALRVTVTYKVKFFFAQMIGRKDTDVKATAIVRFGRGTDYNVLPIGLGDRWFYCNKYQANYGSCPAGCSSGPPSNINYCATDPFVTDIELNGANNSNTAPGFKGALNFDWRWWSDRFVHDVDETGANDKNDNNDDDDTGHNSLDVDDTDDDGDGENDVSPGMGGTPLDDADEDTDRDGTRDEDDTNDDADGLNDNVDPDDDNDGISDVNDPSHEDYNTTGTNYELYSARQSGWFGRNPIIYGDPSTVSSDMRNNAWTYIQDGYPRSKNTSDPTDPLLLKSEQRVDVFTGTIAGNIRDSLVGQSTTSYPAQTPQPGSYVYDHGPLAVIPLIDFYESQGTNGNWFIVRFALVRFTHTDANTGYVQIVNGIINAKIDDTLQILYDANGNIVDSVSGDAGIYAVEIVK